MSLYTIYLHARKPSDPITIEQLVFRLQLRSMQTKVINRSDPTSAQPRKPSAPSVHQSTACLAKVVGYGPFSEDSLFHCEC